LKQQNNGINEGRNKWRIYSYNEASKIITDIMKYNTRNINAIKRVGDHILNFSFINSIKKMERIYIYGERFNKKVKSLYSNLRVIPSRYGTKIYSNKK